MKKILISFLIIIILFIIWIIYGINEIQYRGPLNSCIEQRIEYGWTNPYDLEDVMRTSSKITCSVLTFSPNSKFKSFDSLTCEKETPTHCVYYAKTYKYVFDKIIKQGNLKATCRIERKPIKFLQFIPQICKMLGYKKGYNFTKDHDYCVITYKNEEYIADPCIDDILF